MCQRNSCAPAQKCDDDDDDDAEKELRNFWVAVGQGILRRKWILWSENDQRKPPLLYHNTNNIVCIQQFQSIIKELHSLNILSQKHDLWNITTHFIQVQ